MKIDYEHLSEGDYLITVNGEPIGDTMSRQYAMFVARFLGQPEVIGTLLAEGYKEIAKQEAVKNIIPGLN
jgi:hypothetical protein